DGGAVKFNGKILTINNIAFIRNTSGNSGGAIFAFASVKLSVSGSKFNSNFAGSGLTRAGGGAIYIRGSLSVTNSEFSENLASSYGGAVNFENTTSGAANSNIINSTFNGNGSDAGGGLYMAIFGSVMSVTD